MSGEPRKQIFVIGSVWSLLALASFYFHHTRKGWVFAILAATFLFSAVFVPRLARTLQKILGFLVQLLATLVTCTLMSIVYFLFLSPLGLILRATGSLRTAKRMDPALASYWVDHPSAPPTPHRYLRPY